VHEPAKDIHGLPPDTAPRFQVLGDVAALIGGRVADLGHARQRCVLAVLLVDANRPVSPDQLIDRAWGDRLPLRPRNALHTYLSLLRRPFAATDDIAIERQPSGYVLSVDEAAVDLHRFRELVARARASDSEQAVDLFDHALRLWHGDAFGTLESPWLNTTRELLAHERAAAELDHNDAMLHCGLHGEMLAGLAARAEAHPLDERTAGQLMLALYRSGRQADALAYYQSLRRRLVETLGAEPGQPLQTLHQQILAAHPAVAFPATPRMPVPRQLPSPPQMFTGRTRELGELTGTHVADGPAAVSAISGAGGIGKTWLALRWAHENLDKFPDGQLYVNLRGFDPSGPPMPSGVAIRGFLDAFHVNPEAIPLSLDGQAAMYRSLTAGRRMLIVLDNARDTAQITPLLPGGDSCTVLVTSRRRLAGLATGHSAILLDLDVLPETDAAQLLSVRLGRDRSATEPDAFAELLAWCGGLPLALSIAAARASAHPNFALTVLVEELRNASSRLNALDAGELGADLRAVFSCSYQALPPAVAEAFALLSAAPGHDIGLPAAISLTARPDARELLTDLERAHLLQQHAPGRYRMHDLVRLYALECAQAVTRDAAVRRVVDFYTHTTAHSDRVLDPHRPPVKQEMPADGCIPYQPADEDSALSWLDTEHAALLATIDQAVRLEWHAYVWQLAWALDTFHQRRGHLREHVATWRTGLLAAQRQDNPAAQLLAHRRLGYAYARAGRHDEGFQHLHQALTLARQIPDPYAQAHVHHALAWAWELHGDDSVALIHALHSLRGYQRLDNPVWTAMALNQVGWQYARLGNHRNAHPYCEQALTLNRQHHDHEGEAATLDSLGYIAHLEHDYTRALGHYDESLALLRTLGHRYQEASTLERMGTTWLALDQLAQTRQAWQSAHDMFRDQHRATETQRVQDRLDTLPQQGQ
jgi:DNA-binding SARP family transcriptional activator/tetratricopeptide (TPR) repeat protein